MSLPARIHLIRHGESTANLDQTLYARMPDWQVPLSPAGHEQAASAGRELRDAISQHINSRALSYMDEPTLGVYLSPYVRTQQTWDAMAQSLLPAAPRFVYEDVRLREQEWAAHPVNAAANNKRQTWVEAVDYGAFWYRHPSGESCSDALDRAYGFWERLRRDAGRIPMPSDVTVITHGIQLRLLLMAELDWTVAQFYDTATPGNCARFELRLGAAGRYSLVQPFPRRARQAAA